MNRILTAALMAGVAMPLAHTAHAQQAEDTAFDSNTIIVTARRVEEDLQDVPIAIAAFSKADMAQEQISTELDLQRSVPGLIVRQSGSANQFNYSLRGQSVDTYSNSPPSVLAYTNEAQVVSRAAGTFYDLQSIQVLKGPQGTLFGRNATGGAVLFETAKPKDEFEGYALGRYGNNDLLHVEGAVSLPISSDVRLRIAGFYENGGAFVDNIRNGGKFGKQDLGSVRGTLVVNPLPGVENTTVVQYTKEGGTNVPTLLYSAYGCGETFKGVALNSTADCVFGPADVGGGFGFYTAANPNIFPGGVDAAADRQRELGPWETEGGVPLTHDAKSIFVINTTTMELNDNLTLKNIFMYNESDADDAFNYDGSPYYIFQTFGVPNADSTSLSDTLGFIQKTEQISNEIQLQGTVMDDRLNFVIGGYYLKQEDENDSNLLAFDFSPIAAGSQLRYHAFTTAQSHALFAQGTYALTDRLNFTGGFRWSWEKATSKQLDGSLFGTAFPLEVLKDNKPSWTVSVDYEVTPNLMVYVSHRGSWRAGGYNYSVLPIDATAGEGGNRFNPETTKDVELGLKYSGDDLGVPVTFNVAAYTQWVDNIQRAAYIAEGGTPSLVTTNVPKAKISGVEVALSISPSPWLDFGVSGAYTDARYTSNEVILPNSAGVFTPTFYGPYADAPELTGNVFVQATHDLGPDSGELTVRADVYAQSKSEFSNVGDTLSPETTIASYALVNGRISWANINGSGVTASLFGRNLLNQEYYAGGNSIGVTLGLNTSVPGRSRAWGAEVKVDF
ncbi:MAG: TonB-dependent receptor [Sphingomonadaceae bacterium]|nr:TonB-dependent receptor [Sphingomonadaceae bacterium]